MKNQKRHIETFSPSIKTRNLTSIHSKKKYAGGGDRTHEGPAATGWPIFLIDLKSGPLDLARAPPLNKFHLWSFPKNLL